MPSASIVSPLCAHMSQPGINIYLKHASVLILMSFHVSNMHHLKNKHMVNIRMGKKRANSRAPSLLRNTLVPGPIIPKALFGSSFSAG